VNRQRGENRLHPSGGAEQVPRHGFGRADGELFCVLAEAALDRHGFGKVAERSRSPVSVDVVDVFAVEPRVAQGVLHAARRPLAVLLGRGHVVSVTAHAVTGELGVDRGPALLRVLQLLEHQHSGPFEACCERKSRSPEQSEARTYAN